MIEPAALVVRHRVGSPPPTADVLGYLHTPCDRSVVVAFGRGRVLLCWWPERPTMDELRAVHAHHGFAPPPPHLVREAIEILFGPAAVSTELVALNPDGLADEEDDPCDATD
jgi:hypothetical protein